MALEPVCRAAVRQERPEGSLEQPHHPSDHLPPALALVGLRREAGSQEVGTNSGRIAAQVHPVLAVAGDDGVEHPAAELVFHSGGELR